MKRLPDISFDDFPEYVTENEKMSKIENERRQVKNALEAVEAEITELKSISKADAAAEYLATGDISVAALEPLREKHAGLSHRLSILGEAQRQQREKISTVLARIRTQLRERFKADYGELARRRILALCEAGIIQAEMEEFESRLTALHPKFFSIFGVSHGRVDVTLQTNSEGLAFQITSAIEAGFLSAKDIPKTVSETLGIPARLKHLAARQAELTEDPKARKVRVESEMRLREEAYEAKRADAIRAARYIG